MEIWKDIDGYEGDYMVSNWGNVKSLERLDSLGHLRKERILKPLKNTKGYLFVVLCKDGKMKTFKAHRLVAEAFLDNPDNLPQVNHKNEIKDDNRVENLEWCSAKYNTNYGTCQQRRAEKRRNDKRSKTVYQYTLDGKFIAEYPSTQEVERQTGYANQHISACCNGKRKTSYGYIWCYRQ